MLHETHSSLVTCNYVLCVATDDFYCGPSIAGTFQDCHLLNYFISYTSLNDSIPTINIPTKLSLSQMKF